MTTWLSRLDRAELIGLAIAVLLVLAAAGVPLGVAVAVSPEDVESGRVTLSPPCEYHRRHGEPCPTCGLTRGVSAAMRWRFSQAYRYHAWSVPLAVGLSLAVGGACVLLIHLSGRAARRLAPHARHR